MTEEMTIITKILTDIGGVAFIFYLFWKTTSKTIPELSNSFIKELEQQRADYKSDLALTRNNYQNELEVHRDFFKTQINREQENIDAIIDVIKDCPYKGVNNERYLKD